MIPIESGLEMGGRRKKGGRGCSPMRRGVALMALPVLLVSASGCGSSADSSDAAGAASACRDAQPAKRRTFAYRAPGRAVSRGEELTAVVHTSCGGFSVTLDAKRFPTAVNSFVFLARKGFYDGMPFDRAAAGTYLQGGNPPGLANGPGYGITGQVPTNYVYRYGVVAMYQSGEAPPGHAGSQFFIVLAKPWLDFSSVYAPLGFVAGGFDVLNRISRLGPGGERVSRNVGTTGPIGKLRRAVVIEKISIEKNAQDDG